MSSTEIQNSIKNESDTLALSNSLINSLNPQKTINPYCFLSYKTFYIAKRVKILFKPYMKLLKIKLPNVKN